MVTLTSTNMSRKPVIQERPSSEERLQKDRVTFVLVLLFMAGLIGLLFWLAGVSPPADYNATYYWLY